MASLTIRNVPDEVVDRLRQAAAANGRSMEQEVRALLESRYRSKAAVLDRVRERWRDMKPAAADDVRRWIADARR